MTIVQDKDWHSVYRGEVLVGRHRTRQRAEEWVRLTGHAEAYQIVQGGMQHTVSPAGTVVLATPGDR